MGKYLSREEVLNASVVTEETEAFGGLVLVREMPASRIQGFLQNGVLTIDEDPKTGEEVFNIHYDKVDFADMAHDVIVDEEGNKILKKADVQKLAEKSFGDIERVVTKSFEITDIGDAKEEGDNKVKKE